MFRRRRTRILAALGGAVAVAALVLTLATWLALTPLPASLAMRAPAGEHSPQRVLAADGTALNRSFQGRYNRTAVLPLSRIPWLVRRAFVISEDHRYWSHGGVDWRARLAALWGNLRAGHVERGASTIGEQVARIIRPRPRTYWSHWIAGFDAGRLLRRFGHAQVLAFYLNQVPYAARRRGVAQAARYYFGRDLASLDAAEQLALAVLVRSPGRYDPRRHAQALRRAVDRLAGRMHGRKAITTTQLRAIRSAPIQPGHRPLSLNAGPFVVHARRRAAARGLDDAVIHTTLEPALETFVQRTLRNRVHALAGKGVRNAAALVVDNTSGAVLAWAVAPEGRAHDIDPVTTPRQPGSALKPFVYGLAMAQLGWQPQHVLRDTPLSERIDTGVHRYHNYSGRHYGRVSLRYALANSLNIPAVRTAQAVGVSAIVHLLQRFGFTTFDKSPSYYGPAIVLGDGAVTLFDMVQGYASLARHGQFLPLHVLADAPKSRPVAVLPPAVTSLLASILSDPDARAAEFGNNSVLDLPMRTAVKTGTSSDYHDLWTMGFDNRYTVGVWMGRLDGGNTNGLTGGLASGPVLRAIFAHLRKDAPYAGLWHSPALKPVQACEWMGPPPCIHRHEWELPVHLQARSGKAADDTPRQPVIARPVADASLAIDPRVPRAAQRLRLTLNTAGLSIRRVSWRVDGTRLPDTGSGSASWPLQPGVHKASARVWIDGRDAPVRLGPVPFTVSGSTRKGKPSKHAAG